MTSKPTTKPKRRDSRMNFVLKLSLTDDADLIEWLSSFPHGERHAALKAALRESMDKPRRDALSRLADKTERIWQTINDLPTWLDARLRQVVVVERAEGAVEVEATPRLDAQALSERAARMKKAKW